MYQISLLFIIYYIIIVLSCFTTTLELVISVTQEMRHFEGYFCFRNCTSRTNLPASVISVIQFPRRMRWIVQYHSFVLILQIQGSMLLILPGTSFAFAIIPSCSPIEFQSSHKDKSRNMGGFILGYRGGDSGRS